MTMTSVHTQPSALTANSNILGMMEQLTVTQPKCRIGCDRRYRVNTSTDCQTLEFLTANHRVFFFFLFLFLPCRLIICIDRA